VIALTAASSAAEKIQEPWLWFSLQTYTLMVSLERTDVMLTTERFVILHSKFLHIVPPGGPLL
jgi:hypothetical protein